MYIQHRENRSSEKSYKVRNLAWKLRGELTLFSKFPEILTILSKFCISQDIMVSTITEKSLINIFNENNPSYIHVPVKLLLHVLSGIIDMLSPWP